MFKNTQDFRARAQETDYTKLKAYIDSLPKKTEGFPCDEYGFSYSSAMNLIREKEGGTTSGRRAFVIGRLPAEKFVSRSIALSSGISDRLNKISAEYWQYSKKAIINQLLDEALKNYGY